MKVIGSDCSGDEFDGFCDNEVIKVLPGEMNKAMEIMDMIMNGCNIVAVEDVITAIVWRRGGCMCNAK